MNRTLLSTRLMMPKPRKGTVLRRELFQKLDASGHKRLTVIMGAAGSGKTTLLTSYLENRELSAGWLSLDDECNFIPLFWNYVVKALSDSLGAAADEFSTYLQGAGAGYTEMLKVLINALEQTGEIYFVLDDFHLLNNRELIQSVDYFIMNMPENVHIFLLTRALPELSLSKLEMKDELLRIEDEELRLSQEEGACFLKETLSLSCNEEELQGVLDKADGWIGGLQLLAAAGRVTFAKGTVRYNRYLNDYIAEEIFGRLTQEEQTFLVLTAPFSYFNRRIIGCVLPEIDFDSMLERLLGKNLMLQCVDEVEEIYRYHNLLRDFLRIRFDRLADSTKEQVLRKGARALWECGDQDESLRHLFSLGDFTLVMTRLLEMDNSPAFFYYIARLPVEIAVTDFEVAFQKFFYHYFIFEFDLCDALYNAAVERAGKDPRYEAFYGAAILYREEPYMIQEPMPVDKVLEMEAHPLTKALILTKNAAFLFCRDRFPEALASVQKSIAFETQNHSAYVAYFNQTLKTQICEEMGLLNDALAVQEQTRNLFEGNELLRRFHIPTFNVTVAGLYMKQLRLEDAGQLLEKCREEVAERGGQLRLSYAFNVIEQLYLLRETEQADTMLKSLMAADYYKDILMLASLLKYQLRAGVMTPAMQDNYMDAYLKKEKTGRSLNSSLLFARILIGKGEIQDALSVLDEVLAAARKRKSSLKIVEASLLKGTALSKCAADTRRLKDLFKEAVYYACENRIFQPFFVEAETVYGFYQKYGSAFAEMLSPREKLFFEEAVRLCIAENTCVLSRREAEILQAIADGLTNTDIADKLYISLSTVKSHIASIFRKLEVKSRVMAVEKARQMGII